MLRNENGRLVGTLNDHIRRGDEPKLLHSMWHYAFEAACPGRETPVRRM